jgi:hypothetical protein
LKTAVLVSGQMRSLDKTAEQLKSPYPEAFWIVHAAKDEDAEKAFLLKPNILVIEEQPYIEEKREYAWQIGRGCHGIQSVLRQLWAMQRVWHIFSNSGIEADCVVRLRPDLVFRTPPEAPKDDAIYIPKFCNYWGYNDRFAFGKRCWMETYFNRFSKLDEYILRGGIFHPESFLAYALHLLPIKRTSAIFDTLRKDGSLDVAVAKEEWGDIC